MLCSGMEANPPSSTPGVNQDDTRRVVLKNLLLQSLTPAERTFLILLYRERMSEAETALTLDITLVQVRLKRHQLLTRIRGGMAMVH